MKQPKFSEILRAAASGYLSPYFQNGATFQSGDYATAKSMAGAFNAIATLYERYEQTEEGPPAMATGFLATQRC